MSRQEGPVFSRFGVSVLLAMRFFLEQLTLIRPFPQGFFPFQLSFKLAEFNSGLNNHLSELTELNSELTEHLFAQLLLLSPLSLAKLPFSPFEVRFSGILFASTVFK